MKFNLLVINYSKFVLIAVANGPASGPASGPTSSTVSPTSSQSEPSGETPETEAPTATSTPSVPSGNVLCHWWYWTWIL